MTERQRVVTVHLLNATSGWVDIVADQLDASCGSIVVAAAAPEKFVRPTVLVCSFGSQY